MQPFEQIWVVGIRSDGKGSWEYRVMLSDGETVLSDDSSPPYKSSNVLFQELMSVLDASIFTSLAIAEGVLPEGQLPLA